MSDVPPAAPDEGRSRWAPTRGQLVALVVALCFLAGVVGWAFGRGGEESGSAADVGFLYDMSAHHRQAQRLSNLELMNGADEAAQVFAREVLRDQSWELGLMQAELDDLGHSVDDAPDEAMAWMGEPVPVDRMPGMATPEQVDELLDARGREADLLFLDLMIEHHRGGIHMADAAAGLADVDDVRALAERIERNQRLEIGEMESARTALLAGNA